MFDYKSFREDVRAYATSPDFPKHDQKAQLAKVQELLNKHSDLEKDYNFTVHFDPFAAPRGKFKVEVIIPTVAKL